MAYAALAALAIFSEDAEAVRSWAGGQSSAERLGDAEALVSALGSLGVSEALHGSRTGTQKLEQALARATEEGLVFQVARAYLFLGMAGCRARSIADMDRAATAGTSFCDEHDALAPGRYLRAMRSWIELEQGNWDLAADTVSLVLSEQCLLSCLQARIVLGLLRARRGDPDPWTHSRKPGPWPSRPSSCGGSGRWRRREPRRAGWEANRMRSWRRPRGPTSSRW